MTRVVRFAGKGTSTRFRVLAEFGHSYSFPPWITVSRGRW